MNSNQTLTIRYNPAPRVPVAFSAADIGRGAYVSAKRSPRSNRRSGGRYA